MDKLNNNIILGLFLTKILCKVYVRGRASKDTNKHLLPRLDTSANPFQISKEILEYFIRVYSNINQKSNDRREYNKLK